MKPALRARLRHLPLAVCLALLIVAVGGHLLLRRLDPRPRNPAGSVILYSAAWCGYCDQIRACLVDRKVPFVERDVEASLRASLEWWALGVRGVPATLVGPELVYGFQTAELSRALAQAGHPVACWSAG